MRYEPRSERAYLDAVAPGVEEADAPHVGQDGVGGVVQHVVSRHGGQGVSLGAQVGERVSQGECICVKESESGKESEIESVKERESK